METRAFLHSLNIIFWLLDYTGIKINEPIMKTRASVTWGNSGMQDYYEVHIEEQSMRIWINLTQFTIPWISGHFGLHQDSPALRMGASALCFQPTTFLPGSCTKSTIHNILSKQIFASKHKTIILLGIFSVSTLNTVTGTFMKDSLQDEDRHVLIEGGSGPFSQIGWQDSPLMMREARDLTSCPPGMNYWLDRSLFICCSCKSGGTQLLTIT